MPVWAVIYVAFVVMLIVFEWQFLRNYLETFDVMLQRQLLGGEALGIYGH